MNESLDRVGALDANALNVADSARLERAAQVTPARVLLGRAGLGYRTATQLQLRADHAFARDALRAELRLDDPAFAALVAEFGLFEVRTAASSFDTHLARPDLGRRLAEGEAERLRAQCTTGVDVQLVVGDGLSPLAVAAQVPALLPALHLSLTQRGLRVGRPFLVRHCRVGVMNDIGDVLQPEIVVLLVGERPGLATAESLSAYLAHRPHAGDTDAQRNLISNIHANGVDIDTAVRRITAFVGELCLRGSSGFEVREPTPPGT